MSMRPSGLKSMFNTCGGLCLETVSKTCVFFFNRLFGFSKLKHGNVGHVEQWFPGSTMMIGESL